MLSFKRAGMLDIALTLAATAAVVLVTGCGGSEGAMSEFDRIQATKANALDLLKSSGAKVEEKTYPQGNAWSIDLSGQTITADTLDQLQKVGYISELNFSGSTLTDAFASQLNDEHIRGVLLKLDVSKTEFSDTGLAELKDMNLLRELVVTGSKVTQAGVSKFQSDRQSNPHVLPMFKNVTVKM